MKVLIGCESSGVIREKGHEAYSCDLILVDNPYHIKIG